MAFSCKGRVCPSCWARRTAETAADLVDRVLPVAPYRQWVLTFPWELRFLLAVEPEFLSETLRSCGASSSTSTYHRRRQSSPPRTQPTRPRTCGRKTTKIDRRGLPHRNGVSTRVACRLVHHPDPPSRTRPPTLRTRRAPPCAGWGPGSALPLAAKATLRRAFRLALIPPIRPSSSTLTDSSALVVLALTGPGAVGSSCAPALLTSRVLQATILGRLAPVPARPELPEALLDTRPGSG